MLIIISPVLGYIIDLAYPLRETTTATPLSHPLIIIFKMPIIQHQRISSDGSEVTEPVVLE